MKPSVLDEPAATPLPAGQGLRIRSGGDGSFSLWSEAFGEGFHSSRGARREAHETFLNPSELERFPPGSTVKVLEVCTGTGCNLAVLLEACAFRGLRLDWIGLELDPEPLRLALAQPAFCAPWQARTLEILASLLLRGEWSSGAASSGHRTATATGTAPLIGTAAVIGTDSAGFDEPSAAVGSPSRGRMLWGDARLRLAALGRQEMGQWDLIWHDAFSPQRCPQLWTVDVLRQLSALLKPEGRWISYSSAAAVREGLQQAGLQLAALASPADTGPPQKSWSGGTVASPGPLPASALWRALSPMELEHLASSAGEPYRDLTGTGTAAEILASRQRAQAAALANGSRGSSGAWRRRWGLEG